MKDDDDDVRLAGVRSLAALAKLKRGMLHISYSQDSKALPEILSNQIFRRLRVLVRYPKIAIGEFVTHGLIYWGF